MTLNRIFIIWFRMQLQNRHCLNVRGAIKKRFSHKGEQGGKPDQGSSTKAQHSSFSPSLSAKITFSIAGDENTD